MKNVLGFDLGTNSIGWAVVQEKYNEYNPQNEMFSHFGTKR